MTDPQIVYNDGSGEVVVSTAWDSDPDQAAGLGIGWTGPDQDIPVIVPLTFDMLVGNTPEPQVPDAAALSGDMPSRSSVHLGWVAADNTGKPPLTGWELQVRTSSDDGASFTAWGAATGSPYGPTAVTTTPNPLTGLSVGTPEIKREYRVRGLNADGPGLWSNVQPLQWNTVTPSRPTAPTGFTDLGVTDATHHRVGWSVTPDSSVTKYGLFLAQSTAVDPATVYIDNIDPANLSYVLALAAGGSLANLNVRRWNAQGWSPASNRIDLAQPTEPPPLSMMMTGSSDSEFDSGGTLVWDGWRAYTRTKMYGIANRTGSQRPKYISYSVDGPPLGSDVASPVPNWPALTSAAIKTYVRNEANDFYYGNAAGSTGSGAGSNTRSIRWGIKWYWSVGGNENSDKGYLSGTPTAADIANYVMMMRASWEVSREIDPATGQRRFPDLLIGSNPTQEHERKGLVERWLHPSARWHDFVMWSMYPPGRGVNDTSLSRNPRIDWPFTDRKDEARRNNIQPGFLMRCFYRTKQAEAQARADLGDPTFQLHIACGETGQASDPDNRNVRPYYAVHGLIGSMYVLAQAYALAMDFVNWWDNKTSETAPHNVLSDEPPNSDHLAQGGGGALGNNATPTNPTTRVVFQNWRDYDHRQGGTHPAVWAGFPAGISTYAEQTGTPI